MRRVVCGALALVSCTSCIASEPSGTQPSTQSRRSAPDNKSRDNETSLRIPADGGAPYCFVITPIKSAARGYMLKVTPLKEFGSVQLRDGKLAEFALSLRTPQGDVPVNPVAILPQQDLAVPTTQRIYIVFAGDANAGPPPCVVELLIHLDRLASGQGSTVLNGRTFLLPVVGSFAGTTIAFGNNGGLLIVKVPAPSGDTSQPVMVTYNIRANSDSPEPVNILMVPRVDQKAP